MESYIFLFLSLVRFPTVWDDFLTSAKVRIAFAVRRFSFVFQPDEEYEFWCPDLSEFPSLQFPCSDDTFSHLMCPCLPAAPDHSAELDELIGVFRPSFRISWVP
jgi:hypothetical protein